MFLRKLGKRGAEMVEYAIVLACIAAVGVGFYSSNDSKLTGVLDSLFGNVRQVLGLAPSSNYRYKANVDPEYKQYEAFANELINKVYDELQKYTDENHPIDSVWIKGGMITGFGYLGDPVTNKGGGTKTLDTPINARDLLTNSDYTVQGHTHLIFDRSGNISNKNNGINDISRIYIASTDNPDKKIGELTFKQSNQTFSGSPNYWNEPDYWGAQ